jgi:hypothetical protein
VHEATPGRSILQHHASPQNLHQAIENGDVEAVRRFLQSVGTSSRQFSEALEAPRALTFFGVKYTPLMRAAMPGNEEIVQLLLKAGASVNTANGDGMTPLMLAAQHDRTAVLSMLVQERQNLDSKDKHGNTAILLAAKSGHLMAVRVLADAGADLHCRDENGLNALSWAAMHGHTSIVKTLVRSGADVNLQHSKKYTALYYAAQMDRLETVNVLLELGADTNLQYPIFSLGDDIIYFIDEVAGHFKNYDVMELLVHHMHGGSGTSVLKRPDSFADITPAMMSVYHESGVQLEAHAMEYWVNVENMTMMDFKPDDFSNIVLNYGTRVDQSITRNNLQCKHQRANEIMSARARSRSTQSGDQHLGLYPDDKWLARTHGEWQAQPARAASIVGVMESMPARLPNSQIRALLKQGWRSELASAIHEAWMRVAPAARELKNLLGPPEGGFQLLDLEGEPLQADGRVVEDILFSFALSTHSEQIQQFALATSPKKTGQGKPGCGPMKGFQPPHADLLVQRQAQALIAANKKGRLQLHRANSEVTIKDVWELCEAAREGLLQYWLVEQFTSQFPSEQRNLPFLQAGKESNNDRFS